MTHMHAHFDSRYSDPDTAAPPWDAVERLLIDAELYWLATLRPGGSPHVTPLIGLWHAGAAYVCTGAEEQKARNLAVDPHATLVTGRNALHGGIDVVVEAVAVRVDDDGGLRTLADGLRAKYGDEWSFGVGDGAFTHADGGRAIVFELTPSAVYAFEKGPYTHTRYEPPS